MTDPFRPRPATFPRSRLERAGITGDHLDQIADRFDGLGYRERAAFAHFVNSHTDEAIRARIADDDVTSGQTQPTGGQVVDPQQQQQIDAAAAAGAPTPGAPGPQPTGTSADTTPAPTDPTPPASPEAGPQPDAQQPPAAPPADAAAPPAPADAPAPPADAPAPASEQSAPAAPAPEAQPAATPTVQVGDTAVPADPAALSDLTIDQLRDAARQAGVPVTGRKADLVERVATAAATGEQPAITPEQVQAAATEQPAQPATDAVSAPQATAEAPAPAPAPDAPTGDTGQQQPPAATDGGTVTGGTTP